MLNETLIQKTLETLDAPRNNDFLVLFNDKKTQNQNWDYCENIKKLEDSLRDNINNYVRITEDPNWRNDDLVYHCYVPDKDGKQRSGIY